MEWYWVMTLLIGTTMGLMLFGLPVAFAFFSANIVGAMVFLGGETGLVQVTRNAVDSVVNFTLAPLLMFIAMGEILFQCGLAVKCIDAIERLFTRVPGRLSLAAVGGGIVFSALSGSSMANTAMLGSTLIPEMTRRGYHPSISMGPIMAVGGVAMLIPPSNMAILLGTVSQIPISYLLIGGIVPGVMIGLTHASIVLVRCLINPNLAPNYEVPRLPFWERWRPFVIYVMPLMLLFVVVVGSILGGLATPTESAALGAMGALLFSVAYGRFSLRMLGRSLYGAAMIGGMMLLIIAGSGTFSQILAFSGATQELVALVQEIDPDPIHVVIGMLMILLLLGMIMDSLSMILLTIPFYMPLAQALGIDVIWLGILVLFAIEISGMTPPFGLLLFAMKGVSPPGTTTVMIYRAVAPFVVAELVLLSILLLYPPLVTYLPSLIQN
ncbi:TRAP transporter large permease [Marivibrio halodurans]|uniref:TRAP transporter large permease n=1 Tax=Marivibrio halodurans TaxID=2039722 RepID=A0A8J7SAR4_9PROT|nr:TRAP transporter large permease [Marivibrio halodurans]MBP5858592.1 TRAP transporter large permease [Marivibrio halodurans]